MLLRIARPTWLVLNPGNLGLPQAFHDVKENARLPNDCLPSSALLRAFDSRTLSVTSTRCLHRKLDIPRIWPFVGLPCPWV